MKDSFRQWANKSGGNPVAFKNLMNYPINLAGFIILALWNTLEGMNLLYPLSIPAMVMVNLGFDVLLNVYLFCHILRTNPLKQKPYLTAIIAWNLLDVGFNFLMVIPNSFLWVLSIRSILDVIVNSGILIACYLKPAQDDFIPMADQLTKYNEGIAGTINTTYQPTEDGTGFAKPPNTVVKTIEEVRKPVEEVRKPPEEVTKPVEITAMDNIYAGKLTDSEYQEYVYADRLCSFAQGILDKALSTNERTEIFAELKVLSKTFPRFNEAFQDLFTLMSGTLPNELPASFKVAKEVKERYEARL